MWIPRPFFLVVALVFSLLCAPPFASGAGGGGGGRAPGGGGGGGSGPDPNKTYAEGIALLAEGNCGKAARKFRAVLKVAPRNAQANYLRGRALACDEKWKRASSAFKRAIRYDRELYAAYQYLGIVLVEMDRVDDAREQLAALEDLSAACDAECPSELETARMALEAKLAGAATSDADLNSIRLPDLDDPSARGSAYFAAITHINAGDHLRAIEVLRSMLMVIGPNADVLNYLGFASRRLGRFDESLAYYRQALAVDPDHLGANEYLGELYVELFDLERARAQLRKLDELCPYGCAEYEDLKTRIDDRAFAAR